MNDRRRRWLNVLFWALLVGTLPLAFLVLISLPNEYRSWGGSGVDCDGPAVAVLGYPVAVVYSFGALVFIRRALRRFRWGPAVAAVLCLALVWGQVAKIREAEREVRDPGYQEVC